MVMFILERGVLVFVARVTAFEIVSVLLCYMLRPACCVLRAACCVLRSACCVLRAACCCVLLYAAFYAIQMYVRNDLMICWLM